MFSWSRRPGQARRAVKPAEPILEDAAGRPSGSVELSDGIVRLNSILRSGAPGRGRAPLFLLVDRQRARRDSVPKTAYTHLP